MKIYIIDAFTDKPYGGNPAAVCLLETGKPDGWLQNVASEMNLSETAFLVKSRDGFMLRWFAPKAEVSLCGHATLAAAHFLWEEGLAQGEEIRFHTKSGLLTAKRYRSWIELNFPLERCEETEPPNLLRESLGIKFKYVGMNRMDYIVEAQDPETLISLQPDFGLMKLISSRGVIVTAKSAEQGIDFISRCFYPALGINEDPVTGSAHCCLGPYWTEKLNKRTLVAKQASERGGLLKLEVQRERILIYGQAVTVVKGELCSEE